MKRSVELRQRRAAAVDEANKLIPADGQQWQADSKEKFDRIMSDVDSMKADIDRIEKAETLSDEMRSVLPYKGTSAQPGAYDFEANGTVDPKILEGQQRQYRRTFDKYLRRGLPALTGEEQTLLRTQGRSAEYRDLDNTSGPGGGFLIPQGFQQELEIALKMYGGMRQVSRTITTGTGNALPWPTTNDTSVKGRRLGANAVSNPAVERDTSFGQVQFGAYTYTADVVRVPNELLNDSAFDLEAHLRMIFGERIGRIQNDEFTNLPASSNGPTGWLTQVPVGKVGAAGEVTSIGYDDVIDLEHSVDPSYRMGAGYMCHDNTIGAIRKIKDQYGRPLWGAGLEAGAPDTLNNYALVTNQDMPVMAAGAKSLAFGLWSKFVIRDVANSAVVARLTELYALQNETAFVAFLRSDGKLVDAGTNPIKVYQNAAA